MAYNWTMYDSTRRDSANPSTNNSQNLSDSEFGHQGALLIWLSNGFKVRNNMVVNGK